MNSVLIDLKDILQDKKKIQEGKVSYHIQDIKTYYDLEYNLHIALKVYVIHEKRTRVLILSIEDLEDLALGIDNEEKTIKWFDELDRGVN